MSGLIAISVLLAVWMAGAGVGAIGVERVRGWRTRRDDDSAGLSPPVDDVFELGRMAIAAERVDVAASLHLVVEHLRPEAARHLSRTRIAVADDLLVHADPRALRRALTDMVRVALRLSPCAAILLTARRHGGKIEISCLADGPADGAAGLRTVLRDAEAIFALHGAALELDPRPDGAVMRVRLPEFVARAQQAAARQPAAGQPASESLPASVVRERQLAPGGVM